MGDKGGKRKSHSNHYMEKRKFLCWLKNHISLTACAAERQDTKLSAADLILPGCLQRLETSVPQAGCHSHPPPVQDQPGWPDRISMEHIPIPEASSCLCFGRVVVLNFRLPHLRPHSPGALGAKCVRLMQWPSTTDHPPSPGEHWTPLSRMMSAYLGNLAP